MSETEAVFEIAKKYLTHVKRSGPENIMATCPFHEMGHKVTTTFTMSLTKGLFFCFSCEAKGTLPMFLRDVGMPRAVVEHRYNTLIEALARHRDPEPNALKPGPGIFSTDPLPEGLLGIFDMCPKALLEEGFTEEILASFDVGYDERHQRITYPLRDLAGKLIGISGRTIYEDVHPKYKVYDKELMAWGLPERKLAKGSILWNAHAVYPAVYFKSQPTLVLVEGYKACMWLVQAGIKNTVALMGSYMTYEQQWMLERLGAPVYIMLDNDQAGRKGRDYIGKTLAKSLPVKVVTYDAPQPSDLGQFAVREALEGALEYHCWSIEKMKEASHGVW